MNKINWSIRLKNHNFWLALVPALALVAQAVGAMFGYKWDFIIFNQQAVAIINSVFAVLAIIGVVNDPTTPTLKDSQKAYNKLNLEDD